MKNALLSGLCAGLMAAVTGCVSTPGPQTAEIKVPYVEKGPVIDGKLDDEVWKKSNVYETCFSKHFLDYTRGADLRALKKGLQDRGFFRVVWDDKYLYVGIEFMDKDLIAEGQRDQQIHCSLGDVAEVFLKPVDATYYWELYVTPMNRKTAFFYPGRGHHGLPSVIPPAIPLKKMQTAVQLTGTLNQCTDTDRKWTAEMAVPIDEINAKGIRLAPGVPWKILLARYNFTRFSPKEISAYPEEQYTNFHDSDEYGILILEK